MRLAAALAVLVCGAAYGADGWRLRLLGCGGEELVQHPELDQSMQLELGPPSAQAQFTVWVQWPCGPDAIARVNVEHGGTSSELRVELATTPPALWPRVISLVARQLIRDAQPTSAFSFFGPDSVSPAGHEWLARVSFDTRVYPLQPTAVLSGAIEAGWRWFRLGFVAGGSEAGDRNSQISVTTLLAQAGAVPFRWKSGSWELGAGAFVEGGLGYASVQSYNPSFSNFSQDAALVGGSLRFELAARLFSWLAVSFAFDVGYESGMQVTPFDATLVDLNGFFMQGRLGIGI
ncbi:MAG: hypothetical protein QM723_06465 [Myxococcaceae bacterium]